MTKASKIIESVMFLSGIAIDLDEIKNTLNLSDDEITYAKYELNQRFDGTGIIINELDGKLQLSTNPDVAEEISAVLNPIREREFSQSLLEVAAIVAYRQPITRLEIEEVRGVNSEYALNSLLRQDIVKVIGRKETVGKPLLYSTSEGFLRKFNLKSLDDLPNYEEMLERFKSLNLEEDDELFDSSMSEEEMPDYLKNEEVVKVG